MQPNPANKYRKAKLFSSIYFMALALIFVIGDLSANTYSFFDSAVFVVTCLPLLVNKKGMYLCFGLLNAFMWLYFGIAVFSYHMAALHSNLLSPYWHYLLQYLFVAVSLFCSLLLIYVGLYSPEEKVTPTSIEPEYLN